MEPQCRIIVFKTEPEQNKATAVILLAEFTL